MALHGFLEFLPVWSFFDKLSSIFQSLFHLLSCPQHQSLHIFTNWLLFLKKKMQILQIQIHIFLILETPLPPPSFRFVELNLCLFKPLLCSFSPQTFGIVGSYFLDGNVQKICCKSGLPQYEIEILSICGADSCIKLIFYIKDQATYTICSSICFKFSFKEHAHFVTQNTI